jgi:hypothetical protein
MQNHPPLEQDYMSAPYSCLKIGENPKKISMSKIDPKSNIKNWSKPQENFHEQN